MQRLPTLVPLIVALGAGFTAAPAFAMGFGQVTDSSALGRPLDFSVGLEGDEAIEAQCVNALVVSGDLVLPADQVSAQIEHPGSGERRIRVVTSQGLEDPAVQVILRVGCPPSLSRSFTVLAGAASAPAALVAAGAQGGPSVQERMQALESTVAQLREEVHSKDQSLAELRSRAREAEAARYDNSLVHGLLGLCGLLLIGVVGLIWVRQFERRRAGWWTSAAAEVIEETTAPSDTAPAAIDVGPTTMKSAPGALDSAVANKPNARFGLPPQQLPVSAPVSPTPPHDVLSRASDPGLGQGLDGPRRPMATEELIDLEQQVEFFVVLGQDDAAIDLLMGHVRSTGGVSPLPYLKLLEIYRRRSEKEPYERIRERFNRRFNAYAAGWAVDLEAGKSLEEHPEVLARLQSVWAMPSKSMELLEELLFRRDTGTTFEVPAYRELLFLYGIARDLAERDIPEAGVDLLLPFGEVAIVAHSPPTQAATGLPMFDEPLSLDLDVSTHQPSMRSGEEHSPPELDPKRPPKGSH